QRANPGIRTESLIVRRAPVTAAVAVFVLSLCAGRPSAARLTGGAHLAAIYNSILNAQFDRVESGLQQACPPAPVDACHVLGVVSLWWQIQINPESRVLDRQLAEHAAAASEQSEKWTRREPQNGEAWFYLAGSYAPLVQWRVLRGERVTAAREGGKAKTALEHALALDPDLQDAHFGIGLYRYYADVAPAAAKMLRWLLFLPGGDRVV